MKSLGLMFVSGATAFSCFCSLTVVASDYVLVKKESNIALYEKWIEAPGGQTVREIKVTFSAQANVLGMINLLTNQSKGMMWNRNVKDYKVLGVAGDNSWVTYMRYDIPWPMEDQDCCLAYKVVKPLGSRFTELQFNSILHAQFPIYWNVGRMQGIKGKWIIEEKEGGRLHITYLASTDRSSSIPRWVSDPILQNQLIKTFSTFVSVLEKQ